MRSFSADVCFEPPSKLPRCSISIHHHQFSSSFYIHHNIPCSFSGEPISTISYCDGGRPHHPYTAHTRRKEVNSSNKNIYRNSSSSTTNISSACSMQPHLWSKLPQELVEHILAFLPISNIFRFSRVCKSWHDLFFSHAFLRLRTQLPTHASHHHYHHRHGAYFLVLNRSRYQQLSAYEVISKKWYSFPLDFLPMVAYPVAAAGGLICFLSSNLDTGYTTLIVCNPLTRRWKELPSMLYKRVPFSISMVVDRKAMTYKILVAGGLEDSNLYRRTTEMYDSTTGSWVHCGSLPQDQDISRSMVQCCGYYLCLTRGTGSGLLAFNLQTKVWLKMRTGRIPGYSKFRHLVECGGSILVIGKALRSYVLGLYIWCLDPTTLRWREVGKMPRAICEQFFSSPSECFYCTAQGHLIFFSRYFYNQGLVYNIVDNSWQQVAGCPLLTHPLLLPFNPGLDPVD